MLFTRKFLEALGCKNLYKLRGSAGSGRTRQNLLPASHRADATSCRILDNLKKKKTGIFLLNDRDVQTIKDIYGITDLEEKGSRNLGNTGITLYIDNNQYYIKK